MKKLNKKCLDNVTCKFSEAYYQKMASKRYGIDFCCKNDLDKLKIKKELNDLSELEDLSEEIIVCPNVPDNACLTTCITFNEMCNDSYRNFILFLSQGFEDNSNTLNLIETAKTLFDEDFAEDITLMTRAYVGNNKCFDTISKSYRTAEWVYWGLKLTKYTTPSSKLDMLELVFTSLSDDLILLDSLFTTFYNAYDNWILNDYSRSFLPDQLANTVVTYTSCQGILTNEPINKRSTIYNRAETNITFRNYTFEQSPYRTEFDYDAFLKRKVTIITELCTVEDCSVDGYVYPNAIENLGSLYLYYRDGADDSIRPTSQDMYNYAYGQGSSETSFRRYNDDKLSESITAARNIVVGVNPQQCEVTLYPQYYPLAYPFIEGPDNLYAAYNTQPSDLYVAFKGRFIMPKSINASPAMIDYVLYYEYGIGQQPPAQIEGCGIDWDKVSIDYFSTNNSVTTKTFFRFNDLPTIGEYGVIYNVTTCEPSYPYDPNETYGVFLWNPVDKVYVEDQGWFSGEPDDIASAVREKTLAYYKALNEFTLGSTPLAFAALYLPEFQVTEFKTEGSPNVTVCRFGPPNP